LTKPGGQVLWYDFVYDNPRNPDVRGVPLARIRAVPGGRIDARRLAWRRRSSRALCRIHRSLYTWANLLPFLRTRAVLDRKPRQHGPDRRES
jgi:hypothetical protein